MTGSRERIRSVAGKSGENTGDAPLSLLKLAEDWQRDQAAARGSHGIQPADAGLARGRPEVQDEPFIKRGRHRGGHYSTILFDTVAFEVGKYALRNRRRGIAFSPGQTAILANKNSSAGSEKLKPHRRYLESHTAIGTVVLIASFN